RARTIGTRRLDTGQRPDRRQPHADHCGHWCIFVCNEEMLRAAAGAVSRMRGRWHGFSGAAIPYRGIPAEAGCMVPPAPPPTTGSSGEGRLHGSPAPPPTTGSFRRRPESILMTVRATVVMERPQDG